MLPIPEVYSRVIRLLFYLTATVYYHMKSIEEGHDQR